MKEIIRQDFYVNMEGPGEFLVICYGHPNGRLVPTFGFNKDGEIISDRHKEQYVEPKDEWIEPIVEASANEVNATVVYVAVIRKSKVPKEIGIIISQKEISIPDIPNFSAKVVSKEEFAKE